MYKHINYTFKSVMNNTIKININYKYIHLKIITR